MAQKAPPQTPAGAESDDQASNGCLYGYVCETQTAPPLPIRELPLPSGVCARTLVPLIGPRWHRSPSRLVSLVRAHWFLRLVHAGAVRRTLRLAPGFWATFKSSGGAAFSGRNRPYEGANVRGAKTLTVGALCCDQL
eukprot:291560-Prorocentrum_minimum.AAC.2